MSTESSLTTQWIFDDVISDVSWEFRNVTSSNDVIATPPPPRRHGAMTTLTVVIVTLYGVICVAGLLGNGLVVFVVARYARMKTVTNVYIMNLSVADGLFLTGLPLLMVTTVLKHWVFGAVLCKVYYVLTCVNMFTGAFTLTLMSADRFAAVWYPVKSLRYRKPKYAGIEAAMTWVLSTAVMFPIVLFADVVPRSPPPPPRPAVYRCEVQWPAAHALAASRIYILYTLAVGFVFPVTMVSVFYGLLVSRLRVNRHHIRAAEKQRRRDQGRRRNVTGLVMLVVGVFFFSWLPYWSFQLYLVVGHPSSLPLWQIYLFNFLTILTYANSAVNPILYAYTNDNFKKAFSGAFRCTSGDPLRPSSNASCQSNVGGGPSGSTTLARQTRFFDWRSGGVETARRSRCRRRRCLQGQGGQPPPSSSSGSVQGRRDTVGAHYESMALRKSAVQCDRDSRLPAVSSLS